MSLPAEKITIHGGSVGAEDIGPRCDTIDILADDDTPYRVVVDFGAIDEFIDDGRKVDAIITTHSHFDHVGALPRAVMAGGKFLSPFAGIYGAPQTVQMIPHLLEEGAKLNPGEFDIFDISLVIERLRTIASPGECNVILPGVSMAFPRAGHIPGALSVLMQTRTGGKIGVTGDISWHDQPILKGAGLPSQVWPEQWRALDQLVGVDLTYGAAGKKPYEEEIERLVETVCDALVHGRKVVIFGFQNGRSQNIAMILHEAGIPVVLDGSVARVWNLFREYRWTEDDMLLPSLADTDGFTVVQSNAHREELLASDEPMVFVTTSGMGDFGPAPKYLLEGLPRNDFLFIFTSWLAPGTKGRELMDGVEGRNGSQAAWPITIKDYQEEHVVPVRAAIERIGLSAHSSLDEFLTFVSDIVACRNGEPLERIVLTHGTQETSRRAMRELLARNLAKRVIVGEHGMTIPLKI